jgi:uncharacterized membrane protein
MIAGTFQTPDNVQHGFTRAASGVITTFDVAGRELSVSGVNSKGVVVGAYYSGISTLNCFVRSVQGTITSFAPPWGVCTGVTAINDAGAIIGSYSNDGHANIAFVRSPAGKYSKILPPGSFQSKAIALNNLGQIVGEYLDLTGWHNFLRTP